MNLYRPVTLTILLIVLVSTSCSRGTQPSSSAGALTANSAFNNLAAKLFERHNFNTSAFHVLNEFIKPDVRSRMDEEPVGDTDASYDPGILEPGTSVDGAQTETAGEDQNQDAEPNQTGGEETGAAGDSAKFLWAKKSYGDAVKVNSANRGVIVLYADENYYDVERLMAFVEEGRNRIAEKSAVSGDRIQVVYGGYRAVPQLELWVVPQGSMPELKPDDRSKANEPEN